MPLPAPANDNRDSVVTFTGEQKRPILNVAELDTKKISALRAALADTPITPRQVAIYREQYGTPTSKEIIAHVNTSTPEDWSNKPLFFAFLLAILAAPRDGESPQD